MDKYLEGGREPHLSGTVAELHLPNGDVAVPEEPAGQGGVVTMASDSVGPPIHPPAGTQARRVQRKGG
jgi:hypothetical protein